jgi:imidazolonepropionase-like amidohydrolase
MKGHCRALLAGVASTLLAASGGAAPNANGASFIIAHARVFDGDRTLRDVSVVVDGGVIREVAGRVSDRWRRLPMIDATGATLLPGLIDAHTHTRTVSQLQDALRFGVTTVLDMWTPVDEQQLRQAAASRTDVADLRSSGTLATVPGGHGTEYGIPIPTVSGPDAAAAFVAERVANGANYLKIVLNGVRAATNGTPTMDAATARALVQAGHSRGLLVVAHIENLDDVRIAVNSGVDGLAHIWREGGDAPDAAKLIADRHVFVVPTLVVPDGFVPGTGAALAADPRLKPFLSSEATRHLDGSERTTSSPVLRSIDPMIAAVQSLIRAGTTLVAGTDPPNATVVHGVSLHRELELLVRSGLTPMQALTAATKSTADIFRLSDRGRIAPGRRADLVLVRGDPTRDITATRDILRVWRSGVEFQRAIPARVANGRVDQRDCCSERSPQPSVPEDYLRVLISRSSSFSSASILTTVGLLTDCVAQRAPIKHTSASVPVCPPVCPNAVQEPSSGSQRQPSDQQKTGLKSSISGPFCDSRQALANRRLRPLGHLTAHLQVYVTKTLTQNA